MYLLPEMDGGEMVQQSQSPHGAMENGQGQGGALVW